MEVPLVVVLKPAGKLGQNRCRIGTGVDMHIIPLEGVHKGLSHAVALQAAHRREPREQAKHDANSMVCLAM